MKFIRDFDASPSFAVSVRLRKAVTEQGRGNGLPPVAVSLGGNCSMEFLVPALHIGLLAEGFDPRLEITDYDGWGSAALNGDYASDIWIVWLSSMGLSAGCTRLGELPVDLIASATAAIVARGQQLIVICPEPLAEETDPFSEVGDWRERVTGSLLALLPKGTVVVKLDSLQRLVGEDAWRADSYWTMAKSPCHPNAMSRLGRQLSSIVARCLSPKVRAVVVDLDNTLWGGVVGEDGVHGLDLDPHGLGRPHLHLQRWLKSLSTQGTPLCVVSKNNSEDAEAPFVERTEMILKRDDFVLFEANWNPKADAIAGIAEGLSLGLSSICFLDDSPHEREAVRLALPEVVVPELPEDPDAWVPFLVASGDFMQPRVGEEDFRRVEFYKRSPEPEVRIDPGAYSDFLAGLGMRLTAQPIGLKNLGRVTSLVQKTNQFNLTNQRHGRANIMKLAERPENYAFCFSLVDKYGDAGIIGVLLIEDGSHHYFINTWLMSCRVLNRGVEYAMFDHFVSWRKEREEKPVQGLYVPTPKNTPVAGLFKSLGFSPDAAASGEERPYWTEVPSIPPHHVELEDPR